MVNAKFFDSTGCMLDGLSVALLMRRGTRIEA